MEIMEICKHIQL